MPNRTLAIIGLAFASACLPVVSLAADTPAATTSTPPAAARVESPESWRDEGQRTLERLQKAAAPPTAARNVILFVGDGMGIASVTAARILQGQQRGASGEENALAFERFPATALSKTYTMDMQTSESAGTMTAMMTGVKTRGGSIAIDQVPPRGSCAEASGHEAQTLLERAELAGMATGVITTTRITHATPAATFAHVTDRDWEADTKMPPERVAEGCRDIARQLVEFDRGDGIDVVLGGGRLFFLKEDQADPENATRKGLRRDVDLIAQWQQRFPQGRYVWNSAQFDDVDWSRPGPVLGLFEPDHMKFEADRAGDTAGEPSLAEMTRAAIGKLAANRKGFFLMVEAGRIDHAHHAGNAYRALTDTMALASAVQAAVDLTSEDDTLIIVTADHSHTFGMVGYPARGNPILGLARSDNGKPQLDATGLPYTTLAYINGPGYPGASSEQPEGSKRFPHFGTGYKGVTQGRPNLTNVPTEAPEYLQESSVPMQSESHAGEDVPIYARGPGSQWVRGVLEQNVIYWIMQGALPQLAKR